MQITMRTHLHYLTPHSGHFDARQGSLFAAEDLYGACSGQYRAVANAWHAVGVGDPVREHDFTIAEMDALEMCALGASAPATVYIKHMGCDSTGPISLEIKVRKTNPTSTLLDTLELAEGMAPGEVLEYTMAGSLQFTRPGESVITAEVISLTDDNAANNISAPMSAFRLDPIVNQQFRFHTSIAFRTFRDSIAFQSGEFADLDVLPKVGADSTHGIRIQGGNQRYAKILAPGQDPFSVNDKYGAEMCFCVEAFDLDSLGMSFDLKQTYSSAFQERVGVEQPPTAMTRLLIDDAEVARYIPETNNEDPWTTHHLDLSDRLGTAFQVCFETRSIQSIAADVDSIGDRIFIDNIEFNGLEVLSSTLRPADFDQLLISPNPVTGTAFVQCAADTPGAGQLTLTDAEGRQVHHQSVDLLSGTNMLRVDVSDMPPGMYIVNVRTQDAGHVGKLVVQ